MAAFLIAAFAGCDVAYPAVVIENQLDPRIIISHISYNGCIWEQAIAYGETTTVQFCPSGEDRVHFKKFDAGAYAGGGQQSDTGAPLWYPYKTISVKRTKYGTFSKFTLTKADWEQDFDAPSPYGH
ncbi:MAG: hypothetical protein WC889_05485 [Myxococcota bacterium]